LQHKNARLNLDPAASTAIIVRSRTLGHRNIQRMVGSRTHGQFNGTVDCTKATPGTIFPGTTRLVLDSSPLHGGLGQRRTRGTLECKARHWIGAVTLNVIARRSPTGRPEEKQKQRDEKAHQTLLTPHRLQLGPWNRQSKNTIPRSFSAFQTGLSSKGAREPIGTSLPVGRLPPGGGPGLGSKKTNCKF